MNELYWITRLDAIHGLGIAFIVCAAACITFGFIGYIVIDEDDEASSKKRRRSKRLLSWSFFPLLLGISTLVFVPSTKEALIIYGVGGTIDYVKSNEKAKQLPDKVVDALDKYLDSINDQDTNR